MRELATLMEPAARLLLGEPNPRLSTARELRWGRHGSLAVNVERGIWHDHSTEAGGGVLALIARETGAETPAECLQWLRNAELLPGGTESLSRADFDALEARRRREQAARIRAERREHAQAAERAMAIWDAATPAEPEHGYLRRKHVDPHGARQYRGLLCLPVVDFAGALWSLQFIEPDGSKRLLKDGRKAGNHIPVQEPAEPARLLLCEGWATGATLAGWEPDAVVLAAIDAGNLESVAIAARKRFPDLEIVVCGDADDAGVKAAKRAARAVGAMVAFPEFPPGTEGSDFNDLAAILANRGAA
jgi:putative DNA primase/helicase